MILSQSLADQTNGSELLVSSSVANGLLSAVLAISGDQSELANRRRTFLNVLADLIQADVGVWAWGCGTPDSGSAVAPRD